MADPIRGKVIAVKVTNANDKEEVKITNLSRSSAAQVIPIKDGEASFNTANAGVAWLADDIIQASIFGRINQTVQGTLTGGGILLPTLGGSADTSTPAVDI